MLVPDYTKFIIRPYTSKYVRDPSNWRNNRWERSIDGEVFAFNNDFFTLAVVCGVPAGFAPYVVKFAKEMNAASFHFADDTGREWKHGYTHQTNARNIRKMFQMCHPTLDIGVVFDCISRDNLASA
jgi:hypothetical protein|tara:strand:- start:3835 stop:4212 length:378 start_codon:yes stop_codon:yes gene_type:complete